MRRLLVVALAAGLPVLAAAQIVPNPGVLRSVDLFDIATQSSLIGTAQCNGTAGLDVAWSMKANTSGVVASGLGTVKIYASNKQRSVGTDQRQCWLDTDTTNDTDLKRTFVTQFDDISMQQQSKQTIPAAAIAAMASALGLNCASGTSSAVYLCVLPFQNSSSTDILNGVANGKFSLDTTVPNTVSGVVAQSADGALMVKFTESTTGTHASTFRAVAVRTDGTDPTVHASTGNSSPVRIGGLTNEVEYTVRVIAISVAGNESAPVPAPTDAQQVTGTPHPSEDFWEFYQSQPGAVEQGGCATGAAGALGLLGAAALLRLRRRKS